MEGQDFSLIVMFIATLCWAIGLVNPKAILRWLKKPTRKQLTVYYLGLLLLSFVLGQLGEYTNAMQKVGEWLAEGMEQSDSATADVDSKDSAVEHPELTVHYIDVGQGDATLLKGQDFTILIDAGRHDGNNEVLDYLERMNIQSIDLVVGTHPHADHIGQLAEVLRQYEVKEVWMSGETHTSKIFETVLDAIAESGADYYEPRAGESFQIGELDIVIVSPKELIGDLNESSISMRMQYGNVSFLFTGDAEEGMEEEMLRSGLTLRADIFHLGHHGSSTSNTEEFMQEVKPKLAIYSAGKDNSYGHPHVEVIERLEDMGIPYYGTERFGTIKVLTDGSTFSVETEK